MGRNNTLCFQAGLPGFWARGGLTCHRPEQRLVRAAGRTPLSSSHFHEASSLKSGFCIRHSCLPSSPRGIGTQLPKRGKAQTRNALLRKAFSFLSHFLLNSSFFHLNQRILSPETSLSFFPPLSLCLYFSLQFLSWSFKEMALIFRPLCF